MRVAVTGASGFIGTALVPDLRARGHDVHVVPRNAMTSVQSFAGIEVVVHLANLAHGRASLARLLDVNVEGTRAVAHAALASGVRRLIYLSSVKAVSDESAARALRESDHPTPADAYGRSKLAAEQTLGGIATAHGFEVIVLRPPLVYGPHVRANFLALMWLVDRGWPLPFAAIQNRRSLLYVGNLCDAIATCVEVRAAAGGAFFVSDGPPVSTPELCRALARALDRRVRLFRFPPAVLPLRQLTRTLEMDDSAIRRQLRWKPPFSFEEGLRLTAAWYRNR